MTFRVGQKVVCVDASAVPAGKLFRSAEGMMLISNGIMGDLIQGAIYTVADIFVGSAWTALTLAELKPRGPNDPGYRASRFRPIVERKTDISTFTKMLTPEGVDA